ncbi:serine/threonine protein kinase [bacterium]|nr:MAG: serine/threonine protein kinase [bacterium]
MTLSPIGSVLAGRYRVDSLIGSGGMADVYRGLDTTLDRPVAVKILTDRSGNIRQRFLREARSMARLNHPNIVSVYDAGEADGVSYIIMELAEGRTLSALADEGTTVDHTIALFVELCDALEYAHAQGVIHRDIKPSNIMVSPAGVLKVMDFGLARRTTDVSMSSQAGEIVGTISYLPPERFLGRAGDVAGDLYSLGVVLYELLTGHLPFESPDEDLVAVIFAHINQPPKPPRTYDSAIPEALDALVLRLLAKDPGQRPPSAAQTANELRSLLSSAPQAAANPAATPRPAANDDSTAIVRSMLDASLRPTRSLNQALGAVMTGMLATRNRRYDEAEQSYNTALETLDQIGGQQIEWAKTALKFGLMVLQKATEGLAKRDEITRGMQMLERAIPIFHARHMRTELADTERMIQAFRRIPEHFG